MRISKFTICVVFFIFLSACSSASPSQAGAFYDVVIDSYVNQPTSKNFMVLPAAKTVLDSDSQIHEFTRDNWPI